MRHRWKILLGAVLVGLSLLFYLLHYAVFRDVHHIMIYLVGDIAFVFLEVLLVTLIIHEVLSFRDKRQMLEKLNMVVGAFFSEVGTELLARIAACDKGADGIRGEMIVTARWQERDFQRMSRSLTAYRPDIHPAPEDIAGLKRLLVGKREFLLRLLENPNLLEHDAFTAVLMATFHLTEELDAREDTAHLPPADARHIAGDMARVYKVLILAWTSYMRYLGRHYPYLLSFAMRTNPFDRSASPIVQEGP